MWRPLAPSVLASHFDKYFIGTPNPFMIVAATVRPEVRPQIPAIVHIDGSARPHAVDPDDQPLFAQPMPSLTNLALAVVTIYLVWRLRRGGEVLTRWRAAFG
jgi:predicted NodU family carbamoyl transferase